MSDRGKINQKDNGGVTDLEALVMEIDSETETAFGMIKDKPTPAGSGSKSGPAYFIRFHLDNLVFAVPLSHALEIGHRPNITPLPNLPDWVVGISNIRGDIISIVDLKGYFGMAAHAHKRDTRFIILHNTDMKVGIIVDSIAGLVTLNQSEIEVRKNPFEKHEISGYISGVVVFDDHIMNILDVQSFMASPRMNAFKAE